VDSRLWTAQAPFLSLLISYLKDTWFSSNYISEDARWFMQVYRSLFLFGNLSRPCTILECSSFFRRSLAPGCFYFRYARDNVIPRNHCVLLQFIFSVRYVWRSHPHPQCSSKGYGRHAARASQLHPNPICIYAARVLAEFSHFFLLQRPDDLSFQPRFDASAVAE
jgi:hypothetical protein